MYPGTLRTEKSLRSWYKLHNLLRVKRKLGAEVAGRHVKWLCPLPQRRKIQSVVKGKDSGSASERSF